MTLLQTLATYNELRRNQWLDRKALRRIQDAKLRRLIRHAYQSVPYYRQLFDEAGIPPDAIRTAEDLAQIPITTKSALLAAGPEATVSTAVRPDKLITETTSGSTGQPFTTRFDRRFVRIRDALFLRALTTAGYRFGDRLMLVTSTQGKTSRSGLHYVSLLEPPERLLDALNRCRPRVLYGCVTPLRQLASYIREMGAAAHRPKAVVSTAEALDDETRRLFMEAFGAEVYDIFGLTEMGLVAWECGQHDGYHLAEDTTVTEFIPTGPDGALRLVMTNLELRGMPLIRFQTGDIGVPGPSEQCACGRSLTRLQRIEGRIVDCIRLRDGLTLSPYRLTLALEKIPGIGRYQVIQESLDVFTILHEGRSGNGSETAEAARRVMHDIIGTDARISVRQERSLDPPPGRKFRVVESRLPPGATR
ncbi:phenylacetate--CoA ligase family protein [Rhodospirillaceae bacterium SYSU D60014]|uniref:phenylacetate--CoA ligase family protein n=1 Tax=Virgifigura deserti TaxID=2268457 RepID=UPI000E66F4AA